MKEIISKIASLKVLSIIIKVFLIIILIISLILLAILIKEFLVSSKNHNKKGKGEGTLRKRKETTCKITPVYESSRLSFGNAQHIGKRDEQQDSFAFSDNSDVALYREKGVMAILADGMGGLANGKESSDFVVESMLHYFGEKPFTSSVPVELRNIVVKVNDDLLDYLSRNGSSKSGSTLAAVVIRDYKLFWISLGDSRIYLYRDNRLYTLNQDHNYASQLYHEVLNGNMTLEEAMKHADRNSLTSYMGISQIDKIDQNIRAFSLLSGDKILLCSDGIYGSLAEGEMAEDMGFDAQEAALKLVKTVRKKDFDGQDNMTAVVISVN